MDLNEWESRKEILHPGVGLVSGDRITATIRHESDGSKNINNAACIVIANYPKQAGVEAWFNDRAIFVPYNEIAF